VKAAYASATLSTISGIPRIASDHRPAATGAARANAPSAINTTPATRFLQILPDCGIGHPLPVDAIQEDEAESLSIKESQSRRPTLMSPRGRPSDMARSLPVPTSWLFPKCQFDILQSGAAW
jgi:hypothetical protein